MLIDLGGNLLPSFADGTRDVKTCADWLSELYDAGVDVTVLTPRYYPAKRSVEEFLSFRENVLRRLSTHMPDKCPALYLGCEVYVDERLKYISTIGDLTVLGTRVMIAYMPEGEWEGALIDTIETIRAVGIDVLIAHIDRYPDKYAEKLFDRGYRAIADVSAFVGISNHSRRNKLLSWIDKGYVIGIGTNFVPSDGWICRLVARAAKLIGFEINKDYDKKRMLRLVTRATALIGEERMQKLAEASARVLAGAVNITK